MRCMYNTFYICVCIPFINKDDDDDSDCGDEKREENTTFIHI